MRLKNLWKAQASSLQKYNFRSDHFVDYILLFLWLLFSRRIKLFSVWSFHDIVRFWQARRGVRGTKVSSAFCLYQVKHTFSAFWLRSSVVSVLISLISDTGALAPFKINLIFVPCWGSPNLFGPHASDLGLAHPTECRWYLRVQPENLTIKKKKQTSWYVSMYTFVCMRRRGALN